MNAYQLAQLFILVSSWISALPLLKQRSKITSIEYILVWHLLQVIRVELVCNDTKTPKHDSCEMTIDMAVGGSSAFTMFVTSYLF